MATDNASGLHLAAQHDLPGDAGPSSTSSPSIMASPASSATITRKRPFRRGQRACDACSKRKMRCDQAFPSCTPCTSKGLHCVFTRLQAKRGRPANVLASLKDNQIVRDSDHEGELFLHPSLPNAPASVMQVEHFATATDRPHQEHSVSGSQGGSTSPAQNTISFPTSFSQTFQHHDELQASPLGRHFEDSRSETQLLSAVESSIGWPATLELVNLFFSLLWPMLPIVHQPTFVQALHERQDRTSESFCMLTLNVCAAAAVSSRYVAMPSAVSAVGLSWLAIARQLNSCIRRGAQWIQTMSRTDSCACLQNVILVAHFERSIGSPVADRLLNEAERIAQAFHFGRELPILSISETNVRRRVFWTLYMLDKRRAFLQGQSMSLRADELDIDASIGSLRAHMADVLRDGGDVLDPFAQHVLLSRVAEDVLLRWREACRFAKDPRRRQDIKHGLNTSLQQLMDCAKFDTRTIISVHSSLPQISLVVNRSCFTIETYSRYSVLLVEERAGLLSNMSNVAVRLAAELSSVPEHSLQGLDSPTVSLLELAHRRLTAALQYLDDPFAKDSAGDCATQLEVFIEAARAGKDGDDSRFGTEQQEFAGAHLAGRAASTTESFDNAGLPSGSLLPEHFFDTTLPIGQPGTGTIDFLGDLSRSMVLPSEWLTFFEVTSVEP